MINLDKNETQATWMPCPIIKTINYPGLAYIYPLDQLIIVKQSDAYHHIIGEKNSTDYTIFNNLGQKVFIAVTKLKRYKNCHIKIFNLYGNEVIKVERPYQICKNRFLIYAPPGNFVAVVKELPSCVNAFTVKNWYGFVLNIKARGLFKLEYDITSPEGVVGQLNQWKSAEVVGVQFGISFPLNMNVLDKAVVLGACFFIGCLKYRR